ncbi:hypothetical protein CSUI_008381, partial [Cystoisospora suis]
MSVRQEYLSCALRSRVKRELMNVCMRLGLVALVVRRATCWGIRCSVGRFLGRRVTLCVLCGMQLCLPSTPHCCS